MNTNVSSTPAPPPVVPETNGVSQQSLNDMDAYARANGLPTGETNDQNSGASQTPPAQTSATSAPPSAAPANDGTATPPQPPSAATPTAAAPKTETGAPPSPSDKNAQAPAQGEQPPAQQTPPTQAPQQLAPDEKFVVREGVELNRNQVAFLLDAYQRGGTRDREAADTYREVFQMDAQQAKEQWGPLVTFLRENAESGGKAPVILQGVLDAIASYGPSAEEYMDRALRTYAQHVSQNPQAVPARGQVDPETKRRVDQLEAQSRQQAQERANEYLTRERDALTKQYSVLSDPQVWQQVCLAALPLAQQNPNYTVTQYVQNNKRVIELWQRAFDEQQKVGAQPGGQPPAQQVPPPLPTSGAAPNATQQPAGANEDRVFDNLDDSVADFVKAYPEPI